jgi:acetoin utilization deacetylase AcuC-like enzyme
MASPDPDLNDPDPSPEQRDPEPAEGQGLVTVRAVDPQRLLRIAGVTREVLEEARRIRPEEGAVEHLRQVHGRIYHELKEALPPELYEELDDLTPDLRDGTLAELAMAHAEILGWLEGLFQGTQLALQLQAAHAMGERLQGRPSRGTDRSEPDDPPDGRYL